MMDKDDGLNKADRFWREESSGTDFEYSADFDSLSNSSLENSPFRGFEKEPLVVLHKFDIRPFLDKLSRDSGKVKTYEIDKTLPQLVSNCFVTLVREDLEQLKKEVLENSRLNKIKANGILNMPFLRCKICEKAYESEKKLQNHLENKHMLIYTAGLPKSRKRVSFSDHVIVHELKEYHRCRKCTKIFEEYQSLKSHMKEEHRKRKCYICHYCSKNFVDRMFFKIHIKLHCNVCGLLLPNKGKYLMHRRNVCRVRKKYNCKTCHDSFFSFMDLKDHSYDHLEDLFICDICKSQHSTKCDVAHHILFLHTKKRPKELYSNRNLGNERLYLCNFCEATSIDKTVIDKHVSVLPDLTNREHTGYKDYYFCDQCLMKFDTETCMVQHKWSHFLNTSENSQVRSDRIVKRKNNPENPRKDIRRTFNINKLPNLMQAKIVLTRLDIKPQPRLDIVDNINLDVEVEEEKVIEDATDKNSVVALKSVEEPEIPVDKSQEVQQALSKVQVGQASSTVEVDNDTAELPTQEVSVIIKKAIVDPKSKKTLISNFQCQKCHKYYSSNYCLNRHMLSMHQNYPNYRCNVCEESFVWQSLLESHKCIRVSIPEMPFEDARPEIQFENYHEFGHVGIDELMNIADNEDYTNTVDFDIPAPIVQVTEYQDRGANLNLNRVNQNSNYGIPLHNTYKIVMQEVPIEF